jgi:hypothetical protein
MRRVGILGLAALAALILGFLAKRVMIPTAVHYIAYRAPEQSQSKREVNPSAASQGQGDANLPVASAKAGAKGGSEQLTPSDRSNLNAIIKRKAK